MAYKKLRLNKICLRLESMETWLKNHPRAREHARFSKICGVDVEVYRGLKPGVLRWTVWESYTNTKKQDQVFSTIRETAQYLYDRQQKVGSDAEPRKTQEQVNL